MEGHLMVLLDTCALLYWTLDPQKLSPAGLKALNGNQNMAISSISIWEIGVKVRNKKLELGISLNDFVNRLLKVENLRIFTVDVPVWMKNLELEWENRDPADRTIVATATLNRLPIVTSDRNIRKHYKNSIW
jgi:PIN domain nuclease of toxin-antitoxin system